MVVLSIDPGPLFSAYTVLSGRTCRPLRLGKVPNVDLLNLLRSRAMEDVDVVAIEMVASYGMAVGKEVFETCVWIGRFQQACTDWMGAVPRLIVRADVKLHHCHQAHAKDSNITQALLDRFAPGVPNRGKGTKKEPGWFYGFHHDVWQAYALGVLYADRLQAWTSEAAEFPISNEGAASTPVTAISSRTRR